MLPLLDDEVPNLWGTWNFDTSWELALGWGWRKGPYVWTNNPLPPAPPDGVPVAFYFQGDAYLCWRL
jgi:hypothetical protein